MPKYFLSAHALPHMNLLGFEKMLRSLFRYTFVINMGLIATTLVLLGASLVSMNTSTKAGYDIDLLKAQQKSLIEQNTALKTELVGLQAMEAVSTRVQNLHFNKILAIDYISAASTSVAYLQ